MKKPKTVGEYIEQAPKELQPTLKRLRETIRSAAPKAEEKISYGMPFYEYGGSGYKGRLVYFAVFKKTHRFVYPSFSWRCSITTGEIPTVEVIISFSSQQAASASAHRQDRQSPHKKR